MEKINAQKEAEAILQYCINDYGLNIIKIKVKKIKRGNARYYTRDISIPLAAYRKGINYFYYYVLHEISHFINYDKNKCYGHDVNFKNIEISLLQEFGMMPIYKKAYIKKLKSENGMVLYEQ